MLVISLLILTCLSDAAVAFGRPTRRTDSFSQPTAPDVCYTAYDLVIYPILLSRSARKDVTIRISLSATRPAAKRNSTVSVKWSNPSNMQSAYSRWLVNWKSTEWQLRRTNFWVVRLHPETADARADIGPVFVADCDLDGDAMLWQNPFMSGVSILTEERDRNT
ncbi:hypothetical protein BD324DRAFT_607482 [Kockovaella imperatae]|uniref:Uncharacterized protein n=1 Tax=Kockovaella imperatae TaxID=4999 RepID=A0A1Y1UPI4_9TREE|nr:hypothetical protein BD324DRAFT_607482 [Kockovaella imperatae]ORX39045.1 hypothetical protein BD324DRAFT_607482 [Kockovaella imperatae]